MPTVPEPIAPLDLEPCHDCEAPASEQQVVGTASGQGVGGLTLVTQCRRCNAVCLTRHHPTWISARQRMKERRKATKARGS